MPVPTRNVTLWVNHFADANIEYPAQMILHKITRYFVSPPTVRTRRVYRHLCKAIFFSYDFRTGILDERKLKKFYNRNGFPIFDGQSEQEVDITHNKWDSVESLKIVCAGPGPPGHRIKMIAFYRQKAGERKCELTIL